jgi:hypothetical protein
MRASYSFPSNCHPGPARKLTDENLREPITNAQQHNRTKESSCNQASPREGRLASGGPAARRRTERHIPGERRAFGHAKSISEVIGDRSCVWRKTCSTGLNAGPNGCGENKFAPASPHDQKAIGSRAELNSERVLVARERARAAIDPHWLIALGWALVVRAGGAPGRSGNLAALLGLNLRQHAPFGSRLSRGGHCE